MCLQDNVLHLKEVWLIFSLKEQKGKPHYRQYNPNPKRVGMSVSNVKKNGIHWFKTMYFPQKNIENTLNTDIVTFCFFMEDISSSWGGWQQHFSKKLAQRQQNSSSTKKKQLEEQAAGH